MEEIRAVWQVLQKMMPQAMRRPELLQKYVRLHKPQSLSATQNGYMIEITGDIWVRLPSKKRSNPKPQILTARIAVTGLEVTSEIEIDLPTVIRGDTEELVKAMFLVSLIAAGVFTSNSRQQQAFKKLMKL